MVANDGRVQIVLEQFHHIDGIRARPTQKCRGLKGARARTYGELLRIEHNTGKKRLRLNRANVPLVDSVLQKLGHKLGSGRRERLVEVQNDLLNVICPSSKSRASVLWKLRFRLPASCRSGAVMRICATMWLYSVKSLS